MELIQLYCSIDGKGGGDKFNNYLLAMKHSNRYFYYFLSAGDGTPSEKCLTVCHHIIILKLNKFLINLS